MFQMYTIYDKKAAIHSNPFYVRHVSEALRNVEIGLQDGKAMFARFPADFALYLVGTFNPETGVVMPTATGIPQFSSELTPLVRSVQPSDVNGALSDYHLRKATEGGAA